MNSFIVNLYPKPNGIAASQNLTVASSVVSFDPSGFDYKTNAFFVTVHNGAAVVTFDGSTPSSTLGHVLTNGWTGWWSRDSAISAKLIRHTGTSSQVTISQFTN